MMKKIDKVLGSPDSEIGDEIAPGEASLSAEFDMGSASYSDEERQQSTGQDTRARRRLVDRISRSLGIEEEDQIELMQMLDELVPDGDRMSSVEGVWDRLALGFEDLKTRPPRLLFKRRLRSPIDITKDGVPPRISADFDQMLDSEEHILRALIVNERALSALNTKASEHEAVRSLLMSEMVRRNTLGEQWRYMLPKFMLPIYSMLFEADVRGRDLRINTTLFNRIRDVIIDWSQGTSSPVTRAVLMAAAQRTEDQFLTVLKQDYARRHVRDGGDDGVSELGDPQDVITSRQESKASLGMAESASGMSSVQLEPESFSLCRERLQVLLGEAGDVVREREEAGDDDGLEAAKIRLRRLLQIDGFGGGIDASGRLVFPSVDGFFDSLKRKSKGGNDRDSVRQDHRSEPVSDKVHETGPDTGSETVSKISSDTASGVSSPIGELPLGDEDREIRTRDNSSKVDPDSLGKTGRAPEKVGMETGDSFGGNQSGTPGDGKPESDLVDAGDQASRGSLASGEIARDGFLKDEPDAGSGMQSEAIIGDRDSLISEPSSLPSSLVDYPRSRGFGRSTSDRPFANWVKVDTPAPFVFVGDRRVVDMPGRDDIEGDLLPADMARLEIGDGQWKVQVHPGVSPILGQAHPLMLPPSNDLSYYGETGGLRGQALNRLMDLKSLARPELLNSKGDPLRLLDAIRMIAGVRIQKIIQTMPHHYLGDRSDGPRRRRLALESLARWWVFVLAARHHQREFDVKLPAGFFHGVQAPDFVVGEDGSVFFGNEKQSAFVEIFSDTYEKKAVDYASEPDSFFAVGELYRGVMQRWTHRQKLAGIVPMES